MRRASIALTIAVAGCSFGFAGGGLSHDIKTVAVPTFLNDTADPTLTLLATQAVKQAMESRLGLRAATEQKADAIVHGKVVRYDPDMPAAFTGTALPGTAAQTVTVTKRQVEITISIEVVEAKSGRTLWESKGLLVSGQYDPGREPDGKRKALDDLVNKIISGVQSNW